MEVTREKPNWQRFPALRKAFESARRFERENAIAAAVTEPAPPPPPNELREHAKVEEMTRAFRAALARKHVAKAREARADYARGLDTWEAYLCDGEILGSVFSVPRLEANGTHHEDCACNYCHLRQAVSRRRWHESRERGQLRRFDNVRGCGSRTRMVKCSSCRDERSPVPEGCGVRRICKRCDAFTALKRRARFGRARGRAFVNGHRYGLRQRFRAGGRFTEKMLTLTVPHLLLKDATGEVRERARDDTHARILALQLAWPRLLKKLHRWLREELPQAAAHLAYHRAFEWTPASDGIGHPHFHVYFWSPYIHRELISCFWGQALCEAGWPVTVDPKPDLSGEEWARDPRNAKVLAYVLRHGRYAVRVDFRMLKETNVHAVRELMKGGRRSQLTLSRVECIGEAGLNAFDYAEGWTVSEVEDFCSPDVIARLYMALEGMHLSHASRGFFEADEPPSCACCGTSGNWWVWFERKDPNGKGAACTQGIATIPEISSPAQGRTDTQPRA